MGSADFGRELRRRRLERKLNLREFAMLVHYSKGYLSKIENGRRPPSESLRRVCDDALSAGGELVEFASPQPDRDQDLGPDTALAIELHPDGSGTIRIGESHMRAATVLPSMAIGSAEVLTCLGSIFDYTRHLGRISSPSIVLPMVVMQYHAASATAEQRTGRQRRELLLHSAHTAEFAGWMAQECGDDRGALQWTDLAVRRAGDAGDRHMTSYALVRRAMVSLYSGDSSATTTLAETVLADDAVHPRIRWLAALGAAQGYAMASDHKGSMRALDTAAGLHDAAHRSTDGQQLGPSTLHERPALIEAWCQYDLGNLDDAAVLFDQAMSENPEQSDRARARFGTRRALVYAALGEPNQACALIEPLLDVIRSVDSETIRIDLREFIDTMGRYRGLSALRDIQPALDSALSGR
ncbi:helix-turn-helix domain-containing protein [Nocardia nepalensis]|uniref:helix-turn-helix domain-containing protein n=1 Tax=Nocardia nepalensis TaxID=3375448 RepID=UPI003B6811DD